MRDSRASLARSRIAQSRGFCRYRRLQATGFRVDDRACTTAGPLTGMRGADLSKLSTTGILARGERAHPGFFWLGAAAVTVGVGLHLPMYIESASMNFHLAGMPVDAEMLIGMALIV